MADVHEKEVRYDEYCKKCKYSDTPDGDLPCDECLSEPMNWGSVKPTRFKEKDD